MNAKKLISHFLLLVALIGSIPSCKKDDKEPSGSTATMTDVDGNIYKTIKIGNQWWMAENLKVKTYRDGTPVTLAQSDSKWMNNSEGYCLYDNNTTAPGLLYNGYAVTNNLNIAPQGWHIPTDDEWKELEKYLGMSEGEVNNSGWRGSREGESLKAEGLIGWTLYGNIWSNNESGFTAMAGSCRIFDGTFGNPGLFATGFWWTSSTNSKDEICYRYLDYKTANIYRSHIAKSYGFSIRCVKD